MPLAISSPASLPLVSGAEYLLGGGDGGFGGGAAHVGGGLRFGLGDLGFRHLGAAGDEFLDLAPWLRRPAARPRPWRRR